jgi:hypothetical protein
MVVKRIRQIGPKRILYGSDAPFGDNLKPRAAWAAIVSKLGLTKAELKRSPPTEHRISSELRVLSVLRGKLR